MIKHHQTKANLGVGLAIVGYLLTASLYSMAVYEQVRIDATSEFTTTAYSWPLVLVAAILGIATSALYLWGCINYALGKGYSGWWGLLGLLSIFGLLIMVLMRDRRKDGIDPNASSFERQPINPPPAAYPPPPGTTNGAGPPT